MGLRHQNALVELSWEEQGQRHWQIHKVAATCTDNATHTAIYQKQKEPGVTAVKAVFLEWCECGEKLVEGLLPVLLKDKKEAA